MGVGFGIGLKGYLPEMWKYFFLGGGGIIIND